MSSSVCGRSGVPSFLYRRPRRPRSTLSLHDALPILYRRAAAACAGLLRRDESARELLQADSSRRDRKSTRLNSSHVKTSYAVFCLKKKNVTGLNIPTAEDVCSNPVETHRPSDIAK